MSKQTSVRLPEGRFEKLEMLAQATGATRNAVICQLIDNARVEERTAVYRTAVATLPFEQKNNRHDTKVAEATSVTAVSE